MVRKFKKYVKIDLVMKSQKKKTGFVLVEALLAVTTLATAMLVIGTITSSSIAKTILSRDYLFAHNLLAEGIEVIKNMRNTNELRYPKQAGCWLAVEDDCEKIKNNVNKNYVISLTNGLWQLNDGPTYHLNLGSTAYNPANVNDPQNAYQVIIGGQKSKYFRSIVFKKADDSSADFEVKIQWKDGAKTNTLKKNISMSNN